MCLRTHESERLGEGWGFGHGRGPVKWGTLAAALLLFSLVACDWPAEPVWEPAVQGGDEPDHARQAFLGVIEARRTGSRDAVITYWIGSDRIRRETAKANRDGTVGPVMAGVIVDLASEAVVLYRSKYNKQVSVRLTLAEYSDFLDKNRDRWTLREHGIGAIFVDLDEDEYLHEQEPEVVELSGYPCDRLTINQGELVVTVVVADHSPEIFVPPSLHGAVELNLPAEVASIDDFEESFREPRRSSRRSRFDWD